MAACLGPIGREPAKAPAGVPGGRPWPTPAKAPVKATAPVSHKPLPPGAFQAPLAKFRVLSPFGKRRGRLHTGIDLLQTRGGGDPIFAAADGVVVEAQNRRRYGRTVLIRHETGYLTRYAHMRKIAVEPSQWVRAGDNLGTVGHTGRATTAHLHFEVISPSGQFVDPAAYILHK